MWLALPQAGLVWRFKRLSPDAPGQRPIREFGPELLPHGESIVADWSHKVESLVEIFHEATVQWNIAEVVRCSRGESKRNSREVRYTNSATSSALKAAS
jgi:hypothetical protein